MKKLIINWIIINIFILFPFNSSHAETNSSIPIPSINGMQFGAAEEDVISQLGEPTDIKYYPKEEEIGIRESKLFLYEGLFISLQLSANGSKYYINGITIKDKYWKFSNKNIFIGQTQKEIIKFFQKPETTYTEDGKEVWVYPLPLIRGATRFHFKANALIEISILEDPTQRVIEPTAEEFLKQLSCKTTLNEAIQITNELGGSFKEWGKDKIDLSYIFTFGDEHFHIYFFENHLLGIVNRSYVTHRLHYLNLSHYEFPLECSQ